VSVCLCVYLWVCLCVCRRAFFTIPPLPNPHSHPYTLMHTQPVHARARV
jgi:hypothetical protein